MIYQREGSPYWTAAFYVKKVDGTLVKKAFSTKTTDKDKALDIERDLKRATSELAEKKRLEFFLVNTAEIITAQTVRTAGMAMSLVWEKYSTHPTQSKRTEQTQNTKRIIWNRFHKWIRDNYAQIENINDISLEIADCYLKTIKDKSSSVFNNNKNTLSSVWKVLSVEAGLKDNIWRKFAGAENDSKRYRDFSLDEVRLLLANSSGFWRSAVAVAFYTGLRYKDIVHLRKSYIEGDYITLIPAKTKRKGKSVTIHIHPDLKKILEFQIKLTAPKEDYIFPEVVANYNVRSFQGAFGEILDKCGIVENAKGKVGFHALRHTFVTVNEEMGTSREVIQGVVDMALR